MTIAELYSMAVINKTEHLPIVIDYRCDDSWYDCITEFKMSDVFFDKEKAVITIVN